MLARVGPGKGDGFSHERLPQTLDMEVEAGGETVLIKLADDHEL
jgi:hypothetical protein